MRRAAGPLSGAAARSGGTGTESAAGPEGARRLRRVLLFLLLAGLLGAATFALQRGPWRYLPAPGQSALVDDFAGGAKAPWFTTRQRAAFATAEGRPAIILQGGPGISYAARLIAPAPGVAHIRVALGIALNDVVPSRRGAGAIVLVTSFDPTGRRIAYWPREVFTGKGTTGWQHASLIIPWTTDIAAMRLEIVHAGSAGEVRVRELRIEPLIDAPWYPATRAALIALWAGLGLALLTAGLRHARPRLAAGATAAATAIVLLGGLLPEPLFHDLTAPVEEPLQVAGRAIVGPAPSTAPRERSAPARNAETGTAAADASSPPAMLVVPPTTSAPTQVAEITRDGAIWLRRALGRNVMHAAGFGGVALLAAFVAPPVGFAHIAALAGFAAVTEMAQLLTITRDANLEDVLIDLLGGLAGLAAGAIIRRLLLRRPRADSRNSAQPAPPSGA